MDISSCLYLVIALILALLIKVVNLEMFTRNFLVN